jgi:toxin YoeB
MRLVFDKRAFEDLAWRVSHDRKTAQKIMSLIEETARTPFTGRGKPEPLRHELQGSWS